MNETATRTMNETATITMKIHGGFFAAEMQGAILTNKATSFVVFVVILETVRQTATARPMILLVVGPRAKRFCIAQWE